MKSQLFMHLVSVTTKFTVVLLYKLLGVTCESEYDVGNSSVLNREILPTLPDERMTSTQDGFPVFWFISLIICFIVLTAVGITFGVLLKKIRPTRVADLAQEQGGSTWRDF
ncbi:hypothetical protein HOLleu_01799 [Holothuria leucospilota]|uniref:Uncharacterized protein n=1 Tax=Holothuria leucospilota TaxID=206669 RepID=A0A9Q1CQF1_HOLLE|nr:hypothetical protein HOLleu_01799 [Holothuria leucospilota]